MNYHLERTIDMKKILALLLCVALLLAMAVFANAEDNKLADSIVVLFTNDVHSGIEDHIGYAGLAAYKKHVAQLTPYVTLVDCGDAVQGSYQATVSKGELPIQMMNFVGYDLAILGNHEFDYGTARLGELMNMADAEYLCCNITYSGSGETPLSQTKPYEILSYGDTQVAFIGVSTPSTLFSSTPTHFYEDGELVYQFCEESGEALYSSVQKYVDECRAAGADYVIVLAHLGVQPEVSPFTSYELAQNTTGVDVILDGHSHTNIPCWIAQNPDGEDVLIAQTGTKLEHIGQLVISPDGFVSVGYISDYAQKDSDTLAFIEDMNAEMDLKMSTVVANLDFDLLITDDSGIRMVRSREMALGNLVADSIRKATGADFAYVNGGGVRADLKAGPVTFADIINVNPFGNTICMSEVTGQEILDMLEYFYKDVQEDYVKDGRACGESGAFGQLSGLKCTVHTGIPSSVQMDASDMLIAIGETRRVSDVQILKDGVFVPIDPDAAYTIGSNDYLLKNGGNGMGVYLADHPVILDDIGTDYQILSDYFLSLGNDFSAYAAPAGLTTITK